jgi:hypothetical protein
LKRFSVAEIKIVHPVRIDSTSSFLRLNALKSRDRTPGQEKKFMLTKLGAIIRYLSVAGLLSGAAFAQANAAQNRPDFTGIWTNFGQRGAPARDPQSLLRPEAKKKVEEYRALVTPSGDTPGGFCLGTGMPGSMLGSGGYPMEIIQRADQITIVYEAHNEIRRVYFGNRVLPEQDRLPERNGYSIGRWEGDTLVVETGHLKEQVDQRYPHSAQARIVERYRLTEEGGRKVLVNEMTMTDPAFYTEPYSEVKRWAQVPNGFLMTYECNEPLWQQHLEKLAAAKKSGTK